MRKHIPVLFLILAAPFVWSATANATGARSEAVVGSWAFEDSEDVHTFPSLLPRYGTGIYLDSLDWSTGENAQRGDTSGGIIIGNTSALGVFINRPTAYNRFNQFGLSMIEYGLGSNIVPNDVVAAGEIFNVGFGKKVGAHRAFGVALRMHGYSEAAPLTPGFGAQQQGNLTAAAPPPGVQKYLAAGLTASYSMKDMDMGINILWGWHTDSRNDPRGNTVMAGFTGRMFRPMKKWWDLVIAFNPNLFDYKQKGNVYRSALACNLPVQGGARLKLVNKKLTLALMGGIGVQVGSLMGDDTQMMFSVVSPSAEMGAEYKILRWMQIRFGLKHSWGIWLTGRDPAELPAGDNRRPTFERSDFRTGIGFHYKSFRFDGVVEYRFYKNGPDLIGGAGAGLFSGFSISLHQ